MTRSYDLSLEQVCNLPQGTEKAIQLAVYGLMEDEGHHKQWYLEQVLIALGVELDEIRAEFDANEYGEWEAGIAP